MIASTTPTASLTSTGGSRNRIDLGRVFAAMADPTRRAILTRLAEKTATVSELAEPFDMSLPAVSKHLKVLEQAGLLEREIAGRVHHCRAVLEPLQQAERWIAEREAFWERGLDALRAFLDEPRPDPVRDSASPSPRASKEGKTAGDSTHRALAIVRRDPDGDWHIERFLDDEDVSSADRRDTQKRR